MTAGNQSGAPEGRQGGKQKEIFQRRTRMEKRNFRTCTTHLINIPVIRARASIWMPEIHIYTHIGIINEHPSHSD